MRGGGGGLKLGNDSDQKSDTTSPNRSILGHYKGANSYYNILCELYGSEDEEKTGDGFTFFFNLKSLKTNEEKIIVYHAHAVRSTPLRHGIWCY